MENDRHTAETSFVDVLGVIATQQREPPRLVGGERLEQENDRLGAGRLLASELRKATPNPIVRKTLLQAIRTAENIEHERRAWRQGAGRFRPNADNERVRHAELLEIHIGKRSSIDRTQTRRLERNRRTAHRFVEERTCKFTHFFSYPRPLPCPGTLLDNGS